MGKRAHVSWWDADPAAEPLASLTVGDLLDRAATTFGDREAVVISAFGAWGLNRRWTFAQLRRRADRLAKGLIGAGLDTGARVALWAPNVADWLAVQFAVAKAGCELVTVNPGYRPPELAHVLTDAAVTTLVFLPEFRGQSLAEVLAQARPHLPDLRDVYTIGEYPGFHDLTVLAGRGAEVPDERLAERQASISPQSVSQIQYTSGTSGRPKGAQLTHFGLVNNARELSGGWAVTEQDRWCNPIPLFHIGGGAMITLGSLWRGACQLPQPWFDVRLLLETISAERATVIQLVPTMILRALQTWDEDPGRYDLTSLRVIGAGGTVIPAPFRQEITARWGAALRPAYGLTETSPAVTQVRLSEPREGDLDTVGLPLPDTEVRLVNEAGQVTATGVAGELQVRGYQVMKGYLNRADSGVSADGWFSTGDLATMDDRGYVKIIGRTKDMIIRGGENIYPAEIESVLLDYPSLLEAHVVGIPDPDRGEEVCACVKLSGPTRPNAPAAVRDWLRERLSREKVPRYVLIVDEFPQTSSGKVPKNALRAIAIEQLGLAEAVPPTTNPERAAS
jgi:fatty-acyl-CoA synthase